MSTQISFTISSSCEGKLFSFLLDYCGSHIFSPESATGDFLFKKDDKIIYDKYYISLLPPDFAFRLERRVGHQNSQGMQVIYPFDENDDFLPFLEYERDVFSDNTEVYCRLYLRSQSIPLRFRKDLKHLYCKIQRWIIDNSSEKEIIDGISIFKIKE